MLKVEIKSQEVNVKEGVSKGTGKPYRIVEQSGYVSMPDLKDPSVMLTRRISITLDDNQKPFPPGAYTINDTSFYVNNFGALLLGRLKLSPIAVARAA